MASLPASIPSEEIRWVPTVEPTSPSDIRASLTDRFNPRIESRDAGSPGLRVPQAGAWHAVLAHWSTGSIEPATVVLPTGTGKTETMVALFASERLPLVLVMVPSQTLRTQIADAFETYGVLPQAGVIEEGASYPVVGRIEHHFENVAEMRQLVSRCNVIVTTPSALQASRSSIVEALVHRCGHLFVDEAHHVSATTWSHIRDLFSGKPVLQFTATPYRSDGNRLGGRLVYSFPLGRAQELGYFQRISYISVVALTEPDRAVAIAAVERLREDLDNDLDHLIMARVNRIGRARDTVLPIYQEIAPELEPQLLHSDLPAQERHAALAAIRTRKSRIVVCVDMLGEGFDFPELKVAALHNPHRSLGVALQFIGRFARTREDLGTATAVVARPDPGYDARLRRLYAEDSDWDSVIETLATEAVDEVRDIDQFEAGFSGTAHDEISMHVLRPKMSCVIYETTCDEWQPERLAGLFRQEDMLVSPKVNAAERVAWTIVERHSGVRWADLRSIDDLAHHLHVLHWDPDRGVLYINSSDLDSLHEDLAEAVCGETAQRIKGESVYRAMGDINRPVPTNVGVINLRNRSRRFSMYVGADVYEGFSLAEQQTRSNTNIFVVGYANGERVTMGAAAKGRIWSQRAADSILEWVRWCRELGPKLQDDSISLDAVLRSFVRPRPLEERPNLIPLAIDWPWQAYSGMGEATRLEADNQTALLIDVELRIAEHTDEGAIRFDVIGDGFELPYEVIVRDGRLIHRAIDAEATLVHERVDPEPLTAYLDREGPIIWFESEVLIEGPELRLELEREQSPIALDQLVPLDWSDINIRRESQGSDRDPSTVQARAARRLAELDDWGVVIDDDETGEIADLVALKQEHDRVVIHLVHCKYSSADDPGARLADLYELCGQAHRSAHHRQDVAAMIKNLIRRERRRRDRGGRGLMTGNDAALLQFEEDVRMYRPDMRVTIVQPGLSKLAAETRHLQLLACADLYVREIASGSFDVWCSA
jgi:superfamily II DNA or RNA helicase